MKTITIFLISLLSISLCVKGEKNITELTNRQIRNLDAFAKTYGYIRFFHPSKQALQTDWQDFLVSNVTKALHPSTDKELLAFLDSIFKPIAPTVQFTLTGQLAKNTPISHITPSEKIQYWHHIGCGIDKSPKSTYKSYLNTGTVNDIQAEYGVDLSKPYIAELVQGISIILPIGVPANDNQAELFQQSKKKIQYDLSNTATRLAGIIIAWNELQHFYPYWDLIQVEWDSVLQKSLQKAFFDSTSLQYIETLNNMLVAIQDGHGFVLNNEIFKDLKHPPVWATLAENKIVVKKCLNCKKTGITPGDEIIKIDGVPALELYQNKMNERSGTSQWKKSYALTTLLYTKKDDIELVLSNEKGTKTKKIHCSKSFLRPPYTYKKIEEIEDGIYYVSIDRITDKDFKRALPKLSKAKGIIFELKNYPEDGILPLHHLTKKTMYSMLWNIPEIIYPDHINIMKYDTSGRWKIIPKEPYLGDKKIVFIISGAAISYAESYLGIVEYYKLGYIVGEEPSAGTNGNSNFIEIPGNITIMYTGMKVLKHDGSQHHLIGIKPTHYVTPTIQAIKEERDELIEKALEIIKE